MPTNILAIGDEDAISHDVHVSSRLVASLKAVGDTLPRQATVEVVIVGDEGELTLVRTLTPANPLYVCEGPAIYRFRRTIGAVGVFAGQ